MPHQEARLSPVVVQLLYESLTGAVTDDLVYTDTVSGLQISEGHIEHEYTEGSDKQALRSRRAAVDALASVESGVGLTIILIGAVMVW